MSAQNPVEVAVAYEHCRQIAKREAKNFYYAFRVLPKHKSDAMCAVYAFMRKADDLADDESLSIAARRESMALWTESWKSANGQVGEDPVFLALRDTQERFAISTQLLEQLVAGTTLDLYEQQGVEAIELNVDRPGGETFRNVQVYRSFDELYRYCYLVASVVGLVCIRIFGYTDARAEEYAERVGVAFQLTNVLRDVVEDAQRGRVYLPLEDLDEHCISVKQLVEATEGAPPCPGLLPLLEKEIRRADSYYASTADLIPLLDPDSRVAMEVLASIYQKLLRRIASDPLAVLHTRVSVPTSRKLLILAGGMLRAQLARRQA